MANGSWAMQLGVDRREPESWKWLVGIGAGMALLGIAASINLLAATVAATYVIAAAMAGGGVLILAHGVGMRRLGWAAVWSLCGFIYIVAAASILYTPLFAMQMLTFWLMAIFAISGLSRFALAIIRRNPGWGWMLLSGAFSMAVGSLIAIGWPANSVWVLGLLMSVDLLVQGFTLMLAGFALRAGVFE